MNDCKFMGRLTKDPDLRYTPAGVAVCNFQIAAEREFKNQNNERESDFPFFVAFKGKAETIAQYFKQGKPILIKKSRYQMRRSEGENGQMRYFHEFVVEDFGFVPSDPTNNQSGGQGQSNRNQGGQQNRNQNQNQQPKQDPFQDNGEPIDISDDDLPF